MNRTTGEIKASAKDSLRGNLGTSFLAEIATTAIECIACCVPFGGTIVSGPLKVGKANIYCKNTDRERSVFTDLFSGFRENVGENFFLGIVKSLFIFLWSLLFLVPGIVKAYSYAMAEYLMVRDPSLTAMEAMNVSKQMMKGNKLRLFTLHLSFLGWILLMILTAGIAGIYVIPYMNTASTEFFNDIYYTSNQTEFN